MASVIKSINIQARPEDVWAALRDFAAVHERLVPGFVVDSRLVVAADLFGHGGGRDPFGQTTRFPNGQVVGTFGPGHGLPGM